MEEPDHRQTLNRRVAFEDGHAVDDSPFGLTVIDADHRHAESPPHQRFREQGLLNLRTAG